jgi:LmbE family N-acetylglucosaminyl deacetylase
MIGLSAGSFKSVALIGAHCDDIAIGAGATLLQLVRDNPDVVVNALVLTGGGTEREVEEKNALAMLCGAAEVPLPTLSMADCHISGTKLSSASPSFAAAVSHRR